jgi:nucleotide-binding universal stress UspA family protein
MVVAKSLIRSLIASGQRITNQPINFSTSQNLEKTMPNCNRILCPVDLSENSLGAIELATTLAKENDAKIDFYHVATAWDPGTSPELHKYVQASIVEDKAQLDEIRPTDPSVEFEHHFVMGNAGPEIVKATKESDMVVMVTHGRSGIARLIMGSVAHYVLRYAKCPVYLVKGIEVKEGKGKGESETQESIESEMFVTDVMHQVPPLHGFETMESALKGLNKARETAAGVVDGSGNCVGILTVTDIERFRDLEKRFEEKDETVIDEIFEVDKYGMRRCGTYNFDQVQRHMTKEVISLRDSDSIKDAIDLFEANPTIHHLVVLDEDDHAVGIFDLANVNRSNFVGREKATS